MCVCSTLLQLKIPCVWLLGPNHWMKVGVKRNNMVIPILTVHCLNHIFRKRLWPWNTKNVAILFMELHQIVAPFTEWGMIVFVDCSQSLLTSLGTGCHKWLNCLFVWVLTWVAVLHQECVFTTIWRKWSFGVLFIFQEWTPIQNVSDAPEHW